MDMVDARTPGVWYVRSGVRYIVNVRDRDFTGGTVNLSKQEVTHDLNSYLGVSLLGLVDVAARLPYVWDKDRNNLKGTAEIRGSDGYENGFAGMDVAAKISITLGPFEVAPYLHGRLPSGERRVRDLAELNYGTAVTFTVLNHYLSLHLNLAGVQIEKGVSAFRYRAGLAFVLWSSSDWMLRVFGYGSGIEYEGSGDSDIDLECGLQALLWGNITVELGVSLRMVDGGHVNSDLKRQLRTLQGTTNFIRKEFEDDGTWAVQVGIGTVF